MRDGPDRVRAMPLTVVVLAAGRGRRMNSTYPKVLQPLAGRPMLAHVLDAAAALAPDALNIVYGHGGDAVREAFGDRDLIWTHQAEQLGTGHALAQALPDIPDEHRVLVLCGDMPLVAASSLDRLIEQTDVRGAGLLTATVDRPSGYGRILRDDKGSVDSAGHLHLQGDEEAHDGDHRSDDAEPEYIQLAGKPCFEGLHFHCQ